MSASRSRRDLEDLARLHGVALGYTANDGRRVRAGVDTLVATLAALGHDASGSASLKAELQHARHEQETRVLEPVVVLDRAGRIDRGVRMTSGFDVSAWTVTVVREDGRTETGPLSGFTATARRRNDTLDLDLSRLALAPGYHRLKLSAPGVDFEAMLLVPPPPPRLQRGLGIVAPLYALRGEDDWGVGSFTDLGRLAETAAAWGADLAGILPIFAAALCPPIDPSPYLPVSRLFWNELYVDIAEVPELGVSPRARELVAAARRAELDRVRGHAQVDYDTVAALKRQVLSQCANALADVGGDRSGEFEAFVASHPELAEYADFRAAGERAGGWRSWPSAPGALPEGAVDPAAARYHRYAQFIAVTQLTAATDPGASARAGLYLDFPVGVHPDGYDTWSRSGLFADAQVGAPPDALAPDGQAWGFPPLHPQLIRRDGYRYVIAGFREAFRFAKALRIDHILGLRRLFWIPAGRDARSGAYVRYRDDELRAIIAIEAHRAGAVVIGEDLGTVPREIRSAMDRDRILHSFVYQFAASAKEPLPQPRRPSAASLGGHDLPRFTTWWQQEERRDLVAAVGEPDPAKAVQICLKALAAGPSAYVLVDLADLEGEVAQDNRPGTGPEAGNWQQRLSRPLAEIAADPAITDLMTALTSGRQHVEQKGAAS